MCKKVIFLFVILMPNLCFGESIEFDYSITFSDPVYVPHTYRTDMDCDSEIGFNINDEAYLKRDLVQALKQLGISFGKKSKNKLRLYVTHFDCGSTGKESYQSYPLGVGFKEKDFSSAYLRVITEIENKASGEITSIREFISVARLEKNSSQFLFFHFGTEEKNAQMSDLWGPIVPKIAEGIQEDLKR